MLPRLSRLQVVLAMRRSRWSSRLPVAVSTGVVAAWLSHHYASIGALAQGDARSDFDQLWIAARVLAAGGDPYAAIGPTASFRFPWPLLYPLTTVLAVSPLATLPLGMARALFVGGSATLLAWALTGEREWRMLWFVCGMSTLQCIMAAQWSMLTVGAALTPAVGCLLILKPQNAAVWLVATLSPRLFRALAIGGLVLGVLSILIAPGWVPEWRAALASTHHLAPLLSRVAALPVVLALSRWRRADARLVVALCSVPLTASAYEMLPLVFVAESWTELVVLGAGTLAAHMGQQFHSPSWWPGGQTGWHKDVVVVGAIYPALLLVLRRPNVGVVPAWIERAARRLTGGFTT